MRELALGMALGLALLRAGWAQEPMMLGTGAIANYDKLRAAQPAGLTLTASLPKDHYFQGEIIKATLTYNNKGTGHYTAWMAEGDRSGRLQSTRFLGCDAQGVAVEDPIGWIYRRSIFGGGKVYQRELGTTEITLPINQWLRFDHPGIYTIFAEATNVRPAADGAGEIHLVSNKVVVTITPMPPEIEKEMIAKAMREIEEGYQRADAPGLSAEQNLEAARTKAFAARPAIATLRYLQTPAARAALRGRLDRAPEYMMAGGSFEMKAALLGAPDRVAEAALMLAEGRAGKLKVDDETAALYAELKTYPQAIAYFAWQGRVLTEQETGEMVRAEAEWSHAKKTAMEEIRAAAKGGATP